MIQRPSFPALTGLLQPQFDQMMQGQRTNMFGAPSMQNAAMSPMSMGLLGMRPSLPQFSVPQPQGGIPSTGDFTRYGSQPQAPAPVQQAPSPSAMNEHLLGMGLIKERPMLADIDRIRAMAGMGPVEKRYIPAWPMDYT